MPLEDKKVQKRERERNGQFHDVHYFVHECVGSIFVFMVLISILSANIMHCMCGIKHRNERNNFFHVSVLILYKPFHGKRTTVVSFVIGIGGRAGYQATNLAL